MRKVINMPDRITFDMVKAATKELGLAGGTFRVEMTTTEVTVTATIPGSSGCVTRIYGINDWEIRYQPAEEKPNGPIAALGRDDRGRTRLGRQPDREGDRRAAGE